MSNSWGTDWNWKDWGKPKFVRVVVFGDKVYRCESLLEYFATCQRFNIPCVLTEQQANELGVWDDDGEIGGMAL